MLVGPAVYPARCHKKRKIYVKLSHSREARRKSKESTHKKKQRDVIPISDPLVGRFSLVGAGR